MNGRNYNIDLDSNSHRLRNASTEYELDIDSQNLNLTSIQTDNDLSIENPIINLESDQTELHTLDFDSSISPFIPSELANYNNLINKPSIESILLQGNITLADLDLKNIYYLTTAEWNSTPNLISLKGAIYIYSDYKIIDNKKVPGIKIGDGLAYVIDLPFIDDAITNLLLQHVNNTTIHTNTTEKTYWNNKISVRVDEQDNEKIIFF